ncbi:MAG: flagellar export chaperone FliS [Spirochaetales bacterium]|nr:flagellar export chaperone FliS [Spirochaetales bacterium]
MNPYKAYRETQIKTAGQGKLIVMLYDEAIRQVDAAIGGMEGETSALDTISNALIRAQDLVTELMVSLDFEKGGEIAQGLFSLYMYFNQQLVDANIKKDPEPLREIRKMLTELRTAWDQISGTSPPGDDSPKPGVNIAG